MNKADAAKETWGRWCSTPFSYATGNDCLISVADHIALAHDGFDCLAQYRGRYSTEQEAMAFVDAAGGLVELMADALVSFEPAHTSDIAVGDVVACMVGESELVGVAAHDGVMFRLERGGAEIPYRFLKILKVWSI